ncbi:MAG: DUF433 domain-containing protein [Bryobacteraceae bacterium]|nr:DUF433 domain-containing protein [Bryobacteraceae bacterium]
MTVPGFPRISFDPAILNGQPCVAGTRLSVRRVLDILATYPDRNELFANFPGLTEEDIGEVLRFAAANVADELFVEA